MLSRRAFLVLGAATLLAARYPAHGQGAGASGFVQQFGDGLVAVVNGPGSLAEKERALRPLIDSAVDVDTIARFCLGRGAGSATPQQVAEFTRLFHDVLVNNIVSKVGEYRGVSFRLSGSDAQRGDDTVVGTVVQRPNNAPNTVRWVIARTVGGPKVVDVIAEGTSLRLTQRSDYAAFLSQHGNDVSALLDAMRRQVPAG